VTPRRFATAFPWLAAVLALLVSACARQPVAPTVTPTTPAAPAVESSDPLRQAQRWLEQAQHSPWPDNARLILQATDAYLAAGITDLARQAFTRLPAAPLPGDLQGQAWLSEAALLLAEGHAEQARERLAALADTELSLSDQIRYHRLRAASYAATGNYLEAARERVWLEGLLDDPEAVARNQRAIWSALSHLSSSALIQLRLNPPPDVLSGWMELVLILRSHRDDPDGLQNALGEWRNRYPGHPADLNVLQTLIDQTLRINPHPQHIAVMLPLSGRLQAAGEAIRSGLLAAYYEHSGARPELRFYDTAADPNRIWSLYQEAVDHGTEAVIGPLTKDAVSALGRAGILSVPVLALNRVENLDTVPAGFFQFALAPEDEARQVAREVLQRGQQRVLVLTPDNPWGDRLLENFTDELTHGGGTLLKAERYTSDTRNRSSQVKDLMAINLSEARQNRLTRLLGKRSEYEPRRRQDVEAVVLFAHPEDARLTRPLIRFHLGGELPVYATSHAYEGQENPDDKDMNGLMFCDMPWLLSDAAPIIEQRQRLERAFPGQSGLTRLQAFGFDDYGLLPYLSDLASRQRQVYAGMTGLLSMNAQGQIERRLTWARFVQGRPALLPPSIIDTAAPTGFKQPLKDEPYDTRHLPSPSTGPAG